MTLRIPATLSLVPLLAIAIAGCSNAEAEPEGFRAITDVDVQEANQTVLAESTGEDVPPAEPESVDPPAEEPPAKDSVAETTPGSPPESVNPVKDVSSDSVPGAGPVPAEDAEAQTSTDDPALTETAAPEGDNPSDTVTVSVAKPEPREIKLLVPERVFKEEGPDKALRVSFDDVDLLKILNMEPVVADAPELLPDWLKGLNGERIRLRGFMYPPFQDADLEAFILARDNQICCFGRDPKVYDLVRVLMRDGETTDYIENRPFDVVGVFHIGDDASIPGKLYTLDDAIVISR